jgi:CBS domain containing-hemolysin-like protein
MFMTVYFFIALLLILLNAFFVVAELSVVKARPTLIEALSAKGNPRAKILERAQARRWA